MTQQADFYTPLTWSQTWIRVLTQPSELSFQVVLTDPTASKTRAYTWIAVCALIQAGLGLLVGLPNLLGVNPNTFPRFSGVDMSKLAEVMIWFSVLTVPLAPLLAVLGLIINVAIVQFIAKTLGGTGTYDQLTYAFAAYQAPLGLVSTAIGFTPLGLCLGLPLTIYSLVLEATAIKVVNGFSWGKAIFAMLFIPLLFIGVVMCIWSGVFLALQTSSPR